jgi:MFS family permease
VKRRKPLVLWGYSIAAVARPLIGLATSAGHVLAIRVSDRFGKGIRSAPRDALIADSITPSQRGRAFGFHRAADNLGAVVGPLIAWAVLTYSATELRTLFLWTALPGLISVAVLLIFVHEPKTPVVSAQLGAAKEPTARVQAPATADARTPSSDAAVPPLEPMGAPFWRLLGVIFFFTLGLSTDAFLLLRASQLGVSAALIPILWAALHVVKSSSSLIAGGLSDRLGRRPLILGGWATYAMVYLGFAAAHAEWQAWALFLVYGLYFGMAEGPEKALVAALAPASRRGTAYGWFNAAVGVAALPASIVFGLVWDAWGAEAAFKMGAGIAGVSCLLFALLVPAARRPA